VADNEKYWIERHRKFAGTLESVGKIGTPEPENRRRYARKKRRIVDLLRTLGMPDLTGKTVLDAGCGVGLVSELLYALGATVSGVDASPVAIAEASDRAGAEQQSGRFIAESLTDFRFADRFDLVLCIDVLYHVIDDRNWHKAVRNLFRHTRRGGLLILLDQLAPKAHTPVSHVRFRTAAMYAEVLKDAANVTPAGQSVFLVYRRPKRPLYKRVWRRIRRRWQLISC
jgi:2-polyprenyl-3-methyl-5-hydroxy-6-metoxy-1,4-benzoquinol methylase